MRALAALRMVWASAAWMAVEMTDVGLWMWCVRKLRAGRAALAVSRRVLSVAPPGEARLAREEAEYDDLWSERAPVVFSNIECRATFRLHDQMTNP
jgi:hypothetical protein